MKISADYLGGGRCEFRVWAPLLKDVSVRLVSPVERAILMERDDEGYWKAAGEGVSPGSLYFYRLENSAERSDPASRFQPRGVHGPSQVVDSGSFPWDDSGWKGMPLKDFIIYELHVGTFTEAGTFEAVISQLDYLNDLGVTAIELMPVAQFPGNRNWGYDGVYPFAPQNSYGGPEGLKALIDAAHRKRLAVILDVVYNHLGPEGNYLGQYGPYFTDRYKTPWGDAINFDGPYSDGVRDFFITNALYWVTEYHIDALRLDAIHGIFDCSAHHILAELSDAVHRQAQASGRDIFVIAEGDLNDVRVIRPPETGGLGLDAQWNDDFHHSLHALMTGESKGYYDDFGEIDHFGKATREGFVLSGEYSKYRKRRHGSSSKDRPVHQFIVFSQNHDQIGNRMAGDRLSRTHPLEKLKLAAGAVILSPYLPLLFMGEEYGEQAPFLYFVSHSDDALIDAVREGRKEEFSSFLWTGEIPDPQSEETFLRSRISLELHETGSHRALFDYYRELIRLRKGLPVFRSPERVGMEVKTFDDTKTAYLIRREEDEEILCLYNFGPDLALVRGAGIHGAMTKMLDSSSLRWGGEGERAPERLDPEVFATGISMNPFNFVLYRGLRNE